MDATRSVIRRMLAEEIEPVNYIVSTLPQASRERIKVLFNPSLQALRRMRTTSFRGTAISGGIVLWDAAKTDHHDVSIWLERQQVSSRDILGRFLLHLDFQPPLVDVYSDYVDDPKYPDLIQTISQHVPIPEFVIRTGKYDEYVVLNGVAEQAEWARED